ncbi:MAG: F0F1 ATP synthase subunit delta [Endomicrobium sp.]|jgi:F0F1-type ATP synthase delta subunit|nr:F0F1 ATP synthase subunit delta [Endomicrobium sp.]
MKRSQIKEIAKSIVKYNELSEKDLKWIISNFSRKELKLFIMLLSKEIKSNNVLISFAGDLSDLNKNKFLKMFPNKKIVFNRDDEALIGGVCLEYGDFIFDCSVNMTVKRILNVIKERL